MHAIESRLLEKVASALTPHTALVAKPAHAIAAARPYTPQATVSPTDLFSYKSTEIVKKYKMKNLFFTPLHETRIINAELKFLVTADEFCTITPEGERDAHCPLSFRCAGNGAENQYRDENRQQCNYPQRLAVIYRYTACSR